MITPVLLDASYTQLGEPLDKKVNLQTDMKNSSWFKLQNTKSSTEIVTISIYLIILCFIIVIILILILKLRSSKICERISKKPYPIFAVFEHNQNKDICNYTENNRTYRFIGNFRQGVIEK